MLFQSSLPLLGETPVKILVLYLDLISILSPSAGRDDPERILYPAWTISIHSPSAGRDVCGGVVTIISVCISIHSPSAGRDDGQLRIEEQMLKFQSTLPLLGETIRAIESLDTMTFQSTPPLQGETPFPDVSICRYDISIHSPSAGRDRRPCTRWYTIVISIHSPSAGRDKWHERILA